MMKRSLRPRRDLTVTMPTHVHSIMERVSVILNHCPRLTDAETEAQWVGQAGPRLAQHISGRAQPETHVLALNSAAVGLGKECENKGVPSHHLLGGWPHGQAGALWVGAGTSVCLNSQDSELTNEEEEEKGHLEQSHIPLGKDLGRLEVSPRSAPVQLHYSLTRQVQALSS